MHVSKWMNVCVSVKISKTTECPLIFKKVSVSFQRFDGDCGSLGGNNKTPTHPSQELCPEKATSLIYFYISDLNRQRIINCKTTLIIK